MGILRKIFNAITKPFTWTFSFIKRRVKAYREYRRRKKEEDKIDPFDKMYPLMIMLFFF